jgi:arylesterase/paraoxonase
VIAQQYTEKSTPSTFHPLGIAFYAPKKHLYVVNHSNSKAGHATIDLLQLDPTGLSATHLQTINDPLMYTPNSVAPLSENEILFTNDHRWSKVHEYWIATLETYLALPTGSLIYLNHKTGESHKLADIPFANGVVLLNSTHLAVSSTLVPAVHIYAYKPDFSEVRLIQKLRPNFAVDNLKLDSDGNLLMAGHPHSIACDIVAKTNKDYDIDGEDATLASAKDRKRAPSGVAEWDGNPDGELKYLYVSNEYGLSTTVIRDNTRKWGAVVGLYETGILTFKP